MLRRRIFVLTHLFVQFVNEARFRAQQWMPSDNEPYARAYFADQFETNANFYAHTITQGQRFGPKPVGELMPLSLVQGLVAHCLVYRRI